MTPHAEQSRERRTIDDKRRAELLAEYTASGLSQREFAQREGIDYNTFGAWLWKQQSANIARPEPRLEPRANHARPPADLEVILPSKTVVRGRDAAEVLKLVEALKRLEQRK